MAEDDRPAFLLVTVREAGFVCLDMQEAVQIGNRWEITCVDARAYVIVVGANGSMCIEVTSPVRVEPDDDLVVRSNGGPHAVVRENNPLRENHVGDSTEKS